MRTQKWDKAVQNDINKGVLVQKARKNVLYCAQNWMGKRLQN
jgi:hypothetical protein